jgi:hypothetical protein
MIINIEDGAVNTGFSGTTQPIIQNLGPGNIYLGTTSVNLSTTGIYMPPGSVYELPATLVEGAKELFIQTDGDLTDVRIINVG